MHLEAIVMMMHRVNFMKFQERNEQKVKNVRCFNEVAMPTK
jgi:hypothetical protein